MNRDTILCHTYAESSKIVRLVGVSRISLTDATLYEHMVLLGVFLGDKQNMLDFFISSQWYCA